MIRQRLLVLSLVVLVLTTGLAFTAAISAAAEGESSCKSIVGSWEVVDNQSGAIFFGTYNGGPSEGTVNFTSPNNATSLTHGVWRRTGPCTFADTDIAFLYDAAGNVEFKIKFRADIELSKGGDTAVFDFEFEISLLDGTVVASGASTATGTRIKVEPRSLS